MTVMARAHQRLTPDLVQAVTFPTTRLGRRGLDQDHVLAFCRQVEAELLRLLHERTSLQEEVRRLRARVLARGGDNRGGDNRGGDSRARQRRDQILTEARARAAMVLDDAHERGTQAADAAHAAITETSTASPDRRELEAELAYLRTYCDVYRTHLRAYLDALLRDVDDRGPSEQAPVEAAQGPAGRHLRG